MLVVGTEPVDPPFTCSVQEMNVNFAKSPPETTVAPLKSEPESNIVSVQVNVDPEGTRVPAHEGGDIDTAWLDVDDIELEVLDSLLELLRVVVLVLPDKELVGEDEEVDTVEAVEEPGFCALKPEAKK